MIKQLSESRSLKKITLGVSAFTMVVGLVTAFSLDASAGTTGVKEGCYDLKKYVCSKTIERGGSGTVGLSTGGSVTWKTTETYKYECISATVLLTCSPSNCQGVNGPSLAPCPPQQ